MQQREAPRADQLSDPHSVTVLAARMDALELLPFTDPQAAVGAAAETEREAQQIGSTDLEMRARLIQADASSRLGDVAAAGRVAHEINRWALEHEHRHLLARSHHQLAWFSYLIGDHSAQLEHAVLAVEYLDHGSARMRAHHLLTLAGALSMTGSHEESLVRYQMAEDMAVALGDVDLQMAVLNNRCYGAYRSDKFEESMRTADRMRALAATHGVELEMQFLDTLARAQMGLGNYAEAEQSLRGVAAKVGDQRGVEGDALAQCLLTLAEAQRLLGATDRAGITLDQCLAQCDERGLPGIRVRVQQERAELYADEGDFRQAYDQHKVFHAEAEALLSTERDVRARTLQAVFETDEARRDSVRFREMSLRDPLTGLYNRRFVDERLDTLLREAAASGAPLSVGLVDLDHFKRVNDTLSHEIGDRVLRQVARLLADEVSEPAFAARLGGEEFLLVLPDCTAPDAVTRCEAARRRLRSHAWAPLTGHLVITTSIGVASVAAGRTTRSALLADADRNLYSAKRSGRDRVVTDPA